MSSILIGVLGLALVLVVVRLRRTAEPYARPVRVRARDTRR